MLRRMLPILFALIPATLYADPVASAPPAAMPSCSVRFDNGRTLTAVPLAASDEARSRGLSQREDVSSGMWFAFEQPQLLRFWMRDTWRPLSIGFIDAQGELFQIVDMTPMSLDVHQSSRPGVAALELPQGGFAALGVTPGQRVLLQDCRQVPDN